MNAKISLFVICVEAIIYLLLYNLHGCAIKYVSAKILFLLCLRRMRSSRNVRN